LWLESTLPGETPVLQVYNRPVTQQMVLHGEEAIGFDAEPAAKADSADP
jgi:hypothetical protein